MSGETRTGNEKAGWRGKLAGAALIGSVLAVAWFAVAALGTRAGLWDWRFGMETLTTAIGAKLVLAVLALSVVALVLSLVAAPRKRPFMMAAGALLVSGLTMGRVAAHEGQTDRMPPLNDVQTDWEQPVLPSPALMAARETGGAEIAVGEFAIIPESANARWPGLGGRLFSEVQEEAEFVPGVQKSPKATPYPKLAPLIAAGTMEDGYAAALAAVEAKGWDIVEASQEHGVIEATETSFWFGLKEDILIRVQPDEAGVRIDVRSVSRDGMSDLGSNAKRIRNLLDEMEVRLSRGASAG